MPVAMVDIRVVAVRVGQRLVDVLVRVRLARVDARRVLVLVMLVVDVAMGVDQPLVVMRVLTPNRTAASTAIPAPESSVLLMTTMSLCRMGHRSGADEGPAAWIHRALRQVIRAELGEPPGPGQPSR